MGGLMDIFGGSQSSSGIGNKFTRPLQSNLLDLLGPNKQNGLGAFMMDPSGWGDAGSMWKNIANGSAFSMNSPETQNLISGLQSQSGQNLSSGLANLRSRFALSGQTSTGGSSPLLEAQAQAVKGSNTDFNSNLSQQLFNLFNQNQQRQMQGLGAYQDYLLTPSRLLQSLAPLLSKNTSSQTPGIIAGVSQGMQGLGSLMSGVGAL